MTKTEFQDLLHRYTSSTRQEAEQIILLEKKYPYSQILHSLAARLAKDHSLTNQQDELQLAAVYSADRHVLKEIMSGTLKRPVFADNQINEVDNRVIDEIDYADEVIHDLERLHELKHNFEMLFEDFGKKEHQHTPVRSATKTKVGTKKVKPAVKSTAAKKAKKTTSTAKKKNVIAPVKRKKIKPVVKGKKATPAKKKSSPNQQKKVGPSRSPEISDDLISEIEATKRRLKPENAKQKEQIQLIDQFIKAQPSISSARERAAQNVPAGDLAAFNPGEFNDQIISETLVGILIKQGKKDKAIEVLKKLIWKFPQKKAYFAAQIEELKK